MTLDRSDSAQDRTAGGARPSGRAGLFSPIIDEILVRHHKYVRDEVPRIRKLLEKCARGCGESIEAIGAVRRFFGNLVDDLDVHLRSEEDDLFPLLMAEEEGLGHGPVGSVIRKLRDEHEHAGDALARMHVSLAEALLPEGDHPDIRELHRRLREFEEDLKAHVRAEDLLFARAEGLDRKSGVGGSR